MLLLYYFYFQLTVSHLSTLQCTMVFEGDLSQKKIPQEKCFYRKSSKQIFTLENPHRPVNEFFLKCDIVYWKTPLSLNQCSYKKTKNVYLEYF